MNRTETADPVALLVLAAVVTIEALLTLVVALVALLLTLAGWRPRASAAQPSCWAPSLLRPG